MTPRVRSLYTVLVVDDDPSVLSTYRRLLRRAGYRTLTESDPTRVLSNGHLVEKIDLMLVDYKMPGMDGLSLVAEMRRRECRVPCILISAYLNDDVRSQATHLGVARVLEKPVDVSALRRALEDFLPVAGSQQA